jgi:DNA-binding Lrp family transcriptional regulator
MKDIELRLISELMKNSRRSDRELAKALKVSQPTVSRTIKKLEKEGYIKEYTIIPDFKKLGYQIMGVTLVKRRNALNEEEFKEARKKTTELEKKNPHAALMAVNGIGLNKDTLFVTFYEDYAAYSRAMSLTREVPFMELDKIESFLVDPSDQSNYRLLSMSAIANHILTLRKDESTGSKRLPEPTSRP